MLREGEYVTSNMDTVAELFELSIAAERAAEEMYLGLAAKFAHHQDVADFWRNYAGEEAGHARWLERTCNGSSPEQLSALADPAILENARRFLEFSPGIALEEIATLEDAYQQANDLENSEMNVVFEFIITGFSANETAGAFLRSQLRDHIARLMVEFPARFSHASSRKAVTALE
jgi:rubrerythrin